MSKCFSVKTRISLLVLMTLQDAFGKCVCMCICSLTVHSESLALCHMSCSLWYAINTILWTLWSFFCVVFIYLFPPTFYKANWRARRNYFPLCWKIVRLLKDALSPREEVPRHYLESAKITQRRGLCVIYSAHMPKYTRASAQIDTGTQKHTQTHSTENFSLFLAWKIS